VEDRSPYWNDKGKLGPAGTLKKAASQCAAKSCSALVAVTVIPHPFDLLTATNCRKSCTLTAVASWLQVALPFQKVHQHFLFGGPRRRSAVQPPHSRFWRKGMLKPGKPVGAIRKPSMPPLDELHGRGCVGNDA